MVIFKIMIVCLLMKLQPKVRGVIRLLYFRCAMGVNSVDSIVLRQSVENYNLRKFHFLVSSRYCIENLAAFTVGFSLAYTHILGSAQIPSLVTCPGKFFS